MTNINCSEECFYMENGKCSLTFISLSSDFIGYESDCAYFSPENSLSNSHSLTE